MNNGRLLLFILSFGHLCTDIMQGALPALLPYLKDCFDLSYTVTGSILLAAHLTSSVIQPVFGYLTDRRPFPILLSLGCLVSGIGIALIPYAPNFSWLIAFVMFMGLGTAAFHPEGFKATACIVSVNRAAGLPLRKRSPAPHVRRLPDRPHRCLPLVDAARARRVPPVPLPGGTREQPGGRGHPPLPVPWSGRGRDGARGGG